MISSRKRAQLVECIKDAEKEAQNSESFFLVELVTAATHDTAPKYDLMEIYEALVDSQAWSLLDPLNLLPLLISSDEAAALEMIELLSREGNARESVIAVQEALERLKAAVASENDVTQTAASKHASELVRLIEVCENVLPRLKLRKNGPGKTLRPIIEHLSVVIELTAPSCTRETGRKLISAVSRAINAVLPWLSLNSGKEESEYKTAVNILIDLLYATLSACACHIHATLAQRQFEESNPRLILHSAFSPESERGTEVVKEAVEVSRSLGITSENLATPPVSIGQLIILAHGYSIFHPQRSMYLNNILPVIISSIQQNIAMDESLALLLAFLSSNKDGLTEDIVNNLATLLTSLASTHPDPPTRLVTFRILSTVLSRAPPPVHLAHLSSLLSDCPFPQMRVAAVGLVKDAFLNAINTNDKSLFTSPSLIRALGPVLFRPNPPDLFSNITEDSLKRFLESSESSRLTECLAFYYVLLQRDVNNSSGIKDQDVVKSVENGLLAPLRNALTIWLSNSPSGEDPHALMPLASLDISLDRVDGAILSLRKVGTCAPLT